ncbi:MAG: GerMN domain-containing protein [Thermoleophilia bacterium]
MHSRKQTKGRRRILALGGLIALGLAAVVFAAGCGGDSAEALPVQYQEAEISTTTETTSTLPTTSTSTTSNTTQVEAGNQSHPSTSSDSLIVRVYFADGEDLVPVNRKIAAGGMVGTAALEQLLGGPAAAEKAAGLTSAVPQGTTVKGLTVKDGTATVDLSSRFNEGGGTSSMYVRLGQVLYTLTDFSTVDRVKFRVDGRDLRALGGEGLLIGETMDRAQYERMISTDHDAPSGSTAPLVSAFKVYFIQGERLSAKTRTVPFTSGVGKAAVVNLLGGPSPAEKAQGAGTAIPANTRIISLNIRDGVASVDLTKQFVEGGGSLSMHLRLGQLVYTLTEFPTVNRVQLKVEGRIVKSLGGEGLLIARPLSRSDWASLISS